MSKNIPFALQVQKEICTSCGVCAEACTYNAINFSDFPEIDPYACRLCGNCVQACPSGALLMNTSKKQKDLSVASDTNGIWVLAETENNELSSVTKELLGKANELSSRLGQTVEAILIGSQVTSLASELIAYGAKRVHLVDDNMFASFIEEDYAQVVIEVCHKYHPDILLVGATPSGRGLSARIAALLQTGLTADCTELEIDTKSKLLHQIRPAFGGNLMATIVTPDCRPQMASVRPGIMSPLQYNPSFTGEIVRHDLSTFKKDGRIRVLQEIIQATSGESLGNSKIIIGIGRGVKNTETVDKIRCWAKKLGALVAGSRAAVEAGLIDARMQVGQTGHTISPDLYIAIGISGQIQHTAAITGAKKIIAINPDRTAPIFNVADYGFVSPIEDILPQLMATETI